MENKETEQFKKILNKEDILTSKEDIYPYLYDTTMDISELIFPKCVLFPQDKFEVSKILKYCNENKITIIPRGAGTCHSGGCLVLDENSVILDLSKMNKIIKINKNDMTGIVEAGVVLGDLDKELEKYNLFFPPDPSNLKVSTIGGAIALNSGGPRTFKYGNTKDYIINLEVVMANGDIIKTSTDISKDVTGYDLTHLFVGSEGTLGVVVNATIRLLPRPHQRLLSIAYFDSIKDAVRCVNNIIDSNVIPSTIDLLDKKTLNTIEKYCPCSLLVDFEAALLIEIDDFETKLVQDEILKILNNSNVKATKIAKCEKDNENIWRARRSAFGAVAKLKPIVITEDIVVPKSKIPDIVSEIERIAKKYDLEVLIMGHAGDGNIHPNFALDKKDLENFKLAKDELFESAIKLNGSLSGEHGIGIHKKKYLKSVFDDKTIFYMKKIKEVFDCNNILNTDKLF